MSWLFAENQCCRMHGVEHCSGCIHYMTMVAAGDSHIIRDDDPDEGSYEDSYDDEGNILPFRYGPPPGYPPDDATAEQIRAYCKKI